MPAVRRWLGGMIHVGGNIRKKLPEVKSRARETLKRCDIGVIPVGPNCAGSIDNKAAGISHQLNRKRNHVSQNHT